MLRRSKDPIYLRFELVRYAREHGIKPAARQFGTAVKTVRKWLRRWDPGSLRGLADRSRTHPPAARRHRLGAPTGRLAQAALAVVGRSAPQAGLLPELIGEGALAHLARGRALEAEAPEAQDQAVPAGGEEGVAALRADLRRYEGLVRHSGVVGQAKVLGLPRYQYTAREVTSGWHYMAFAQECTLAYAKLFI